MSAYIFKVALGSGLIGIACGLVGVFCVIQKESLVGDAISHASLPGIAISFLLLGHKSYFGLFFGAVLSGILALSFILGSYRYAKISFDSSLSFVLSSFFGFGMVLLGIIQKLSNADQAGIDKYIFGQAAAFLQRDLWIMIVINLIVISTILLFYKEFKLFTLDKDYSTAMGFSANKLRLLLSLLLILTIMGGLQIVGLILMTSLIICPATCARFLSDRLSFNLLISSVIGFLSGILGTFLSVNYNLPTGPVIALISVLCVIVSSILSPKHGILFQRLYFLKLRKGWKKK